MDATEILDRLDMTDEDVIETEKCVNCHSVEQECDGRTVDGWGWLCQFCYEDMWDARIEWDR